MLLQYSYPIIFEVWANNLELLACVGPYEDFIPQRVRFRTCFVILANSSSAHSGSTFKLTLLPHLRELCLPLACIPFYMSLPPIPSDVVAM